jgi:hypothetical protein
MAASIGAFIVSIVYVVFVAGAQAETIRRHEVEIQEMRNVLRTLPSKDDVNRVEVKLDALNQYLLNQQKR